MKKITFLLVSVIAALSACKKDDSNNIALNALSGTYSYNERANISIKKWIAGGNEVNPEDTEFTSIIQQGKDQFKGVLYVFGPNYSLVFIDSLNSVSDTTSYKIKNNLVYVFFGTDPLNDDEYIPLFHLSGNIIYAGTKLVSYVDAFGGQQGLGVLDIDNSYLVDTALKEMGYTSLSQLKTNEKITYITYKDYFKIKP